MQTESSAKRVILLVDDESDVIEPMRFILARDYEVLTANSGEEALAVVAANEVELVIADQRMPGMSGVELLIRLREAHPEMVRLILTAYTDFKAMLTAINEGRVYRYVIKPWDVDDMRLTIRQALEWKDLRRDKGDLAADLVETNAALARRTRELEHTQSALLQREKLAAVGRFAAEMVHDMNNNLQVVLAVASELTAARQDELHQLQDLTTHTRTLAEITSDIRDFALGAANPLTPRLLEPRKLIREVARACGHHPDFKDRRLHVDAPDLPSWQLDQRQIKHLLINLLRNAAGATARGGHIELVAAVRQDVLVISVVDHGRGIPEPERERIWQPFFTTRGEEGTGLGLAVARQVVELHGGSIACTDTPGGGATFTVRIPRGTDEELT